MKGINKNEILTHRQKVEMCKQILELYEKEDSSFKYIKRY